MPFSYICGPLVFGHVLGGFAQHLTQIAALFETTPKCLWNRLKTWACTLSSGSVGPSLYFTLSHGYQSVGSHLYTFGRGTGEV
jgi:hypothetical protein